MVVVVGVLYQKKRPYPRLGHLGLVLSAHESLPCSVRGGGVICRLDGRFLCTVVGLILQTERLDKMGGGNSEKNILPSLRTI